jgi:hypothetical protein
MRRPSVIISHLDELLLAGAFLEIKTQDEKAAASSPLKCRGFNSGGQVVTWLPQFFN